MRRVFALLQLNNSSLSPETVKLILKGEHESRESRLYLCLLLCYKMHLLCFKFQYLRKKKYVVFGPLIHFPWTPEALIGITLPFTLASVLPHVQFTISEEHISNVLPTDRCCRHYIILSSPISTNWIYKI